MSLLSSTLGRFVPRFRTLGEWIPLYIQIINARQITVKTLANRHAHIRRIVDALGSRRIGSIRPHEIGALITAVHEVHPVAAKRTLVEARCMFDEALANGWVLVNPARAVRMPRVKVTRRRLALNEWQRISDHALRNQPPWVWRMVLLALVTGQRRSDLVKMQFSDVWAHDDGHEYLHITQAKTGMRVAIPLALRLKSIDVSVGEAIELCRGYAPLDAAGGGYLLRKTTLRPPCPESMSWRFEQAREAVLPAETAPGLRPPTLHECRSLAAREYLRQGINTMILLGHSKQAMTDLYHDDRGLDAREGRWRTLEL